MIHFITGKPGGGKSMFAMMQVIRELLNSERDIVTNLPIRREVLSEYLQRTYPKKHIPLLGPDNRLTLLDEGREVRTIYKRYRDEYEQARRSHASLEVLEAIYFGMEKEIGKLQVPVQTAKFWEYRNPRKKRFDEAVGTLFVLDEVHLYFNARKWQETGEEGLRYLSQHRHFSDDVILVTQHADNVDGQFRRLVEDWSVIKNGYTQKLGWFRALPRFTRAVYTTQPTGGIKQTPFERTTFSLDAKGVAACYNTAAAAGVMANGADTGRKPRGLHPAWFVVMVVSAALFLGALIKGANAFATQKLVEKVPEKTLVVDTPKNTFHDPVGENPHLRVERSESRSDRDQVRVRGYIVKGGKVNVLLTDGRTVTERDGLSRVSRNSVEIDGETLWLAEAKDRPERSSQPAVAADLPGAQTPALPLPPAVPESSWEMASDGVSRLKQTETLADAFKR
jgi:hypothetical protein